MKKIIITLLIFIIPSTTFASLNFGAATSDRVSIPASTLINDMPRLTVAMWVKVTTHTTSRTFWGKKPSSAGNKWIGLDATVGELRLRIRRTGGAVDYITNSNPIPANEWRFIAFTMDYGLSSSPAHIYSGGLNSVVKEATYSTATSGTGSSDQPDTGNPMQIGNFNSLTAIQGQIAWVGVWNRVLTLEELRQQQFRPSVTSGSVVFMHLGFSGQTTQADWSGKKNNGTITGATISKHVPIRITR